MAAALRNSHQRTKEQTTPWSYRTWWRGVAGLLALCVTLCCMPGEVRGHGRMLLPPSRPSAFRLNFNTPINYDDHQQNCGGRKVQKEYGGKCGICGDPWQPTPRPYERPGGALAKKSDYILSSHHTGSNLTATIQITVVHLGYYEFYLCNVDSLPDPVEATPECLQQHRLPIMNKGGALQWRPVEKGAHDAILQLPEGLVCNHCVLQWKYKSGNDWNDGCLGCGAQEEFYSCADISITYKDGSLPTTHTPPVTTTTTTTEHPYHFVPTSLRPPSTENVTDQDPPTQEMIRFYLCFYCMQQVIEMGATPPSVCVSSNFSFLLACPR